MALEKCSCGENLFSTNIFCMYCGKPAPLPGTLEDLSKRTASYQKEKPNIGCIKVNCNTGKNDGKKHHGVNFCMWCGTRL